MADASARRVPRRGHRLPRRQRRAEDRRRQALRLGRGRRRVALFEEVDRELEQAAARARPRRGGPSATTPASAGSAGPKEYGGRDLPAAYERVYGSRSKAQLRRARPELLRHRARHGRADDPRPRAADDVQERVPARDVPRRHRRLPAVQRAGRRLRPGRRCRRRPSATATSGSITGQKVWTSGAQYSDIGEIICRTDPDLPEAQGPHRLRRRHAGARRRGAPAAPDDRRRDVQRGVLQRGARPRRPPPRRRQPGLDRRPHHAHERAGVDRRRRRRRRLGLANGTRLIEMLRHFGLDHDPIVPPGAGEALHRLPGGEVHEPAGDGQDQGRPAARPRDVDRQAGAHPEHVEHRASSWPRCSARASPPTPASGAPTRGTSFVLGIPGMRIAGGSDEVMRNIVGERVLGLPKDPGIDTKVAFKDLKVGTQTSTTDRRTAFSSVTSPQSGPLTLERWSGKRTSCVPAGNVRGMPVHGQVVHEHPAAAVDRASGRSRCSAALWRGHG